MHIRLAPLLALLVLPALAGAADPAVRREALLTEIELAQSKQLYLVIDPAAGEVQLTIQNVVVRRFPAEMRVGLPAGHADAWPAAVFKLHSGLPEFERPVIRPPTSRSSTRGPPGRRRPPSPTPARRRRSPPTTCWTSATARWPACPRSTSCTSIPGWTSWCAARRRPAASPGC
ncbi:MAG: hypothetical protein IPH09_10510 [bacterium]|nr:hypothetical protein [bacterium]